ncbi:hypothetical protein M2140_001790 [Clostridiales Family XIII bacterium PM5-7]
MNRKKMIGIGLVVVAIAVVLYAGINFLKDDDAGKEVGKDNLSGVEETLSGSDEKDIDVEAAEEMMKLTVVIPEKVGELIPDRKALENEITNYLIEQDFYEDVTRANGANSVTQDFDKNLLILSFRLNDKVRTTLDVTIDISRDSYDFNFY